MKYFSHRRKFNKVSYDILETHNKVWTGQEYSGARL